MKRVIMLADCQSFYASVEKAANPQYADKPIIVAGDVERRNGIVLAACPIAKKYGVKTEDTVGSALAKCPNLVVVSPRMNEYIRISVQITSVYNQYTDLVEPYSIDEQHLDLTGSLNYFGCNAEELALMIQSNVKSVTGVYVRVGISENKVLAKMACDNYAKLNEKGIYTLEKSKLASTLWQLEIQKMFMVGSKMKLHLNGMGIYTIGDLANYPVHKLIKKWGVNGQLLWRIANGIDKSPVVPGTHSKQKEIGHHMTLPRDYKSYDEIKVPLRELTEQVCQRARAKRCMGSLVSVSCRGASFEFPTGFHRQQKIDNPTYTAAEVYVVVMNLFSQHWDGLPIRAIGVSLGKLITDNVEQLKLFNAYEKQLAIERVADEINNKFGSTAIIKASSLTKSGQALDRAGKIGGHNK